MIYLAHETGGLFFNGNDIPGAIGRATDDQLGYYLLGYSPPDGTFEKDSQSANPGRHRILRESGLGAA